VKMGCGIGACAGISEASVDVAMVVECTGVGSSAKSFSCCRLLQARDFETISMSRGI
jgi:hypothetical protein